MSRKNNRCCTEEIRVVALPFGVASLHRSSNRFSRERDGQQPEKRDRGEAGRKSRSLNNNTDHIRLAADGEHTQISRDQGSGSG